MIPILIPAYKPNRELIILVKQLLSESILPIVVVNDGSCRSYDTIFKGISNFECVKILKHEKNLGKGAALKTGITYIQENNYINGVVTVDADGQHHISDIKKVWNNLKEENNLILGVREELGTIKTPMRSRIGNVVTQKIFYLVSGHNIKDTQTGLRGIPSRFFHVLLGISYNRYEYEMEMLVLICQMKNPIIQVPIKTIYLSENSSSHFNPIIDSVKIYFVLIRQGFHRLFLV